MNSDMTNYSKSNPYMYCKDNSPMQQYNTAQYQTSQMQSPVQFPVTSSPITSSMPSMPSVPSIPQQGQQDSIASDIMAQDAVTQQGPPPLAQVEYIPGFLARHIGRYVKAEFIVGTNQFVDKTGRLVAVGVNYFVLQDIVSRNNVMCDLYSVRFVTLM